MSNIHSYILFPESFYESFDANSINLFERNIEDFLMTINLADCEINSKLYYSKTNKEVFFESLRVIEEISDIKIGSYDLETVIDILFNENTVLAINEDRNSVCRITSYNSIKHGLFEEIPILFFDLIKKNLILSEMDKQIVLNLFNSYISQNPILFIVDCTSSNGIVKTIEVPYVTKFVELDKWLIENRLKRNFNLDDNRHIENHPQNKIVSHNKSPLIGGLRGKQNAEDLLKNAIGDKKSMSNKLDLMNFDSSNEAYIWYEDENANNQYHAYHLVTTKTYERDEKAESRISDRVKKILKYRERTEQKY